MNNKEVSLYIFFGVLTTAVNYLVYVAAILLLHFSCITANTIAWIRSVVIAFITNQIYVLASRPGETQTSLRELSQFVTARLLSVGVETALLFLCVVLLGWNEFLVKIATNVLVVILNYAASKWIIFRSK